MRVTRLHVVSGVAIVLLLNTAPRAQLYLWPKWVDLGDAPAEIDIVDFRVGVGEPSTPSGTPVKLVRATRVEDEPSVNPHPRSNPRAFRTDCWFHQENVCIPRSSWRLGVVLTLASPPFVGDVESTYEVYLDVFADQEGGDPDSPWSDFHPDYRFVVSGADGRVERELYQAWKGDGWVGEAVPDAPELDVAVVEGAWRCDVSWEHIGNPTERPANSADSDPFLKVAFKVTRGDDVDYLANLDTDYVTATSYSDCFVDDGQVDSAAEPQSWAQIKGSH